MCRSVISERRHLDTRHAAAERATRDATRRALDSPGIHSTKQYLKNAAADSRVSFRFLSFHSSAVQSNVTRDATNTDCAEKSKLKRAASDPSHVYSKNWA